jgi:hypothetical protein
MTDSDTPFIDLGKWKAKELRDKKVEFRFTVRGGRLLKGIGTFLVSSKNKNGCRRVDIVTTSEILNSKQSISTVHHIPQWGVDRIRVHPDPSSADFQLV